MISPGFMELAEKAISQAKEIGELKRQLTAYQIAKDNLELRLRDALGIGLEGGPRRIPDGMTLLHGTKQVY